MPEIYFEIIDADLMGCMLLAVNNNSESDLQWLAHLIVLEEMPVDYWIDRQ